MLVCNVSLRPPRRAISSDLSEAATAVDATATGTVVFAALVDDPASVADLIDAYLGEIMLEAASAGDAVSAGSMYAAAIDETASATDATTAALTYDATVDETTTAADAPSAAIISSPLAISGTPVTTGTEYEHGVGSTYAGFTVTASGGATPYTYSIASGALPAGITLNSSTGAVSGTPAFESASRIDCSRPRPCGSGAVICAPSAQLAWPRR